LERLFLYMILFEAFFTILQGFTFLHFFSSTFSTLFCYFAWLRRLALVLSAFYFIGELFLSFLFYHCVFFPFVSPPRFLSTLDKWDKISGIFVGVGVNSFEV
jgi:hypothetical protein